jgi:hypothetical protein
MAGQPPDTGRHRNQVRPLRSTVSSVRGKANRHRSTRVFGSKTSCAISGPTSTTIEPIPQWKGERRICLRHDQSQISARFDGNLTVDPYVRHQWLRDFPKTLDRSGIRSTLGRLPIKSFLVFTFLVAARLANPIVSLQPYQFARDNLSRTFHFISYRLGTPCRCPTRNVTPDYAPDST